MLIPADWSALTPAWMTEALAERFPGAQVATVTQAWESVGNNRRVRFALTYSAGSGPDVVFCKAEGAFREVHAQNGNLYNEPLLLGAGLPLEVDHPDAYFTLIEESSLDWLVVMEDVARRGADTRDATRPMTVNQVTQGVRGLARLHRRYWEFSGQSVPALSWVQTWESTEGFLDALKFRMARGIELMDGAVPNQTLPPELDAYTGDEIVDLCGRYLNALGRDPVTLLHGDAHIGNTYVLPDDTVGFLDWQVARRGNWSQDVGYFIQGALEESDRRAHERDIVEAYRTELDRGLSSADAWTWYRASPLYGLPVWLATLGSEGAQTFEISTTLSRRYALAAVELDSFEALQALEATASRES